MMMVLIVFRASISWQAADQVDGTGEHQLPSFHWSERCVDVWRLLLGDTHERSEALRRDQE